MKNIENRVIESKISEQQLQNEFSYIMSEKILNEMLDKGLINQLEFDKIIALNRETFSPFLAKIMP
jgi:hypothetical protein